jgi:hypothetical protein
MTDTFEFELDPNSKESKSYQLLMAIGQSNRVPLPVRVAAASAASKLEPQYLYSKVEIPDFETVGQAESFQVRISKLEAARHIDTKTAAVVIARVQNWINNQRAGMELDIKRLNANQDPDHRVAISFVGTGTAEPPRLTDGADSVRSPDGVGLRPLPGTHPDLLRDTAYGEWKANGGHDPGIVDVQPTEPVDHPTTDQDPGP